MAKTYHIKNSYRTILLFVTKISLYITIAASLAICIRIFVGEFYRVPSASMENAILTNDIIWVNKLAYGAKLPTSISEIPFIGNLFGDASNEFKHVKRVKGLSEVRRNDIVVFTSPERNKAITLVKRCVGLSGEIIQVKENKIFINGQLQTQLPSQKYLYRVDNPKEKRSPLLSTRNSRGGLTHNLTSSDAKKLIIEGYSVYAQSFANESPKIYPSCKTGIWNYQNYGPIWIPEKGKKLLINNATYSLYNDLIKDFEGEEIIKKEGKFYLKGNHVIYYKFKYNYYFTMGDNRDNAIDSRFFGFVSEELINGKVSLII